MNQENDDSNNTKAAINETMEDSLDSEMGMSIDDEEFRQLFEQEDLWSTSAKAEEQTKEDIPHESIDFMFEPNDPIVDAIEDLNVKDDNGDYDAEPISDLGHLPEFPEFSIDDLPIFNRDRTDGHHATTVEQAQPTKIGSNSRSFRQRNAIQLNPFTVEYAQYKNLLGRAKQKKWTSFNTNDTDTQVLDTDEALYSQYIPSLTEKPHVEIAKRKSAPSTTKKKSKPQERSFVQQEEHATIEKYGLEKLILPPLEDELEKKKDKVITFKKKRKSKQHRSAPRKIPRLQESLNKDIFAFEDTPHSVFNIAKTSSSRETQDDFSDGDDEDTSSQLHFRRRKRINGLLDSDDEDDDVSTSSVNVLSKAEADKIFNFPRHLESLHDRTKRLERKITDDDDVVPVVADEFEYRDHKVSRVGLDDIMKQQKVLKSVLPASYLKVYKNELLKENQLKKKKRQKQHKSTTSKHEKGAAVARPIDDVYAAFQESQDDDSSTDDDDKPPVSIDDYVIREDSPKRNNATAPAENKRVHGPQRHTEPTSARTHSNKYPLPEAVEYNRIRQLYSHAPKKNKYRKKNGQKQGSNEKKIPKSNLHQPHPMTNYFDTNNNTEDDVDKDDHSDYFWGTFHSEEEPDPRIKYNEDASTTYYHKYPSLDIRPERIKESKAISRPSLLPPLEAAVKRITNTSGFDLSRVIDSKVVYLDKQLPLLSMAHQKSAYAHLKQDFEELTFFKTHFLWTDVVPKESGLVCSLFSHMTKDIQCASEGDLELPDHGSFYTFVSLCLALWIPCLPKADQQPMIELFTVHVRNAAWLISKLVREKPHNEIPWKALTTLAIFVLDWTCRLYELGVHPVDWSVVDYTRLFMDLLVYGGCDDARDPSKQYFAEAWVCLIHILAEPTKRNDVGLTEHVFTKQLKESIHRLASSTDLQVEKNWADTLNYILDRHIEAVVKKN